MHLLIQSLYYKRNWKIISKKFIPVFHITFVSLAIISMFYMPIFIGDYRFDLRTIPMAFITLLHGPQFAIPTLIITSVWRLFLGGPGAVPGVVFGLMIPTLISLAIYYLNSKRRVSFIKSFFLFSVFWLISDIPIVFFLPDGWNVFLDIALMRFLSFQISAYILQVFVELNYKQLQLVDRLHFYANHDPLTSLFNMRRFVEIVHDIKPCYIAMLDIDYFKKVNDSYGHQSGDKVLKELATILSEFRSKQLVVGRYGGEEFIIAIKTQSELEAVQIIESIRQYIEKHIFYTVDNIPLKNITISAGVASFSENCRIEQVIEKADNHLYTAKQSGRNLVVADHTNV